MERSGGSWEGARGRAGDGRIDKTERAFSTGRVLLPLFALEATWDRRTWVNHLASSVLSPGPKLLFSLLVCVGGLE